MSNITSKIDDENFTNKLEIDKIYEYGLYKPRSRGLADRADSAVYDITDGLGGDVGVTFESLNGDLGKSNTQFVDPNTGISKPKFNSESFKIGTFARGYFYGFDFPDRYHEAQFSQDTVKAKNNDAFSPRRYFINSYSLCANVFIPYNSIVFVTYQGFFSAEAFKKYEKASGLDLDHNYYGNRFNHHLYIDKNRQPSMKSTAPSSKMYQEGSVSPREYRWRWQNRSRMVYLSKGYHEIELLIEGCLPNSDTDAKVDQPGQKLQHRCGSMSLCAIKAGNQSATRTPFWAYMKEHPTIGVFSGDITEGGWTIDEPEDDGGIIIDLEDFVIDTSTTAGFEVGDPPAGVGFGADLFEEDTHSHISEGMLGELEAAKLFTTAATVVPKTVILAGKTVTGSSD